MRFLFSILLFASFNVQAKVEVLFHPHDPTFDRIGQWLEAAQTRIDVAMYSLDTSDSSPIVQVLKSPAVQSRLQTGDLKIRLIYEGYGTAAENAGRMAEMEALGIDVRYLGKSIDIHHKFAVIDPGGAFERVITGSANWSLSSFRNYNENILFFENEPGAAARYQTEFDRLWARAKEFGNALPAAPPITVDLSPPGADLKVHFNSPLRLKIPDADGEILTNQIVRLIDTAKAEIDIATTRLRLTPVLDSILRASQRGIKLRVLLSQDDFHDLNKRKAWLFGQANIQLRVKFYNLKPSSYLAYQMHDKLMIVDGKTVLTGSFNWSNSSENNFIENLVELSGTLAQSVLPSYNFEFSQLWDMGRAQFPAYLTELAAIRARGEKPPCGFTPTALYYGEIRKLIRENPKCGNDK